ncbi:uncharacterized protein LOC109146117 isoform X3 [Corvus cornix cornix]|uniref:uncharacterized protein LOC109146117 isoform X3 n=1 Tax=Corvus cornix cornix TaxID=932674 RepID=UPI001951832B|nr:uncharacterized protein LOC109146117 isoform X3 [Corvus cornix cornix]
MAQPISVVAGEEAAGPRGTGSVTPAQPISVVAGEEAAGLCFTPAPGGLDYVMTWSVANLALQLGRSCAAGPFPRRLLINLLKASLCDFDITFPIMTRINPEA